MAEIGIEGKVVNGVLDAGHLSLVHTDDSGAEFVIRGGPENDNPFNFGRIVVEV